MKRQCTKVGCKNLFTFSHKNHLCRFYRKRKKILEKELHHNFMQLLAQELVMTKHTTYPKVSYRRFIDFEILQI
jgi:hypothetical protein